VITGGAVGSQKKRSPVATQEKVRVEVDWQGRKTKKAPQKQCLYEILIKPFVPSADNPAN
jgi:hypothetical protein